jgi:hypothetical protein
MRAFTGLVCVAWLMLAVSAQGAAPVALPVTDSAPADPILPLPLGSSTPDDGDTCLFCRFSPQGQFLPVQVVHTAALWETEFQRCAVWLGTCTGLGYEAYLGHGVVLALDGTWTGIPGVRLQWYPIESCSLNLRVSLAGRFRCWADCVVTSWTAPAWLNVNRWVRQLDLRFPREAVSGCGQRCLSR